MGEAVAGDITPHDGVTKGLTSSARLPLQLTYETEEKYKMEDFGFRYIESLLKASNPTLGSTLRSLWLEFEQRESEEAKYMYQVDKFECMIQAFEYERKTFGEKDLDEFQGQLSRITSGDMLECARLLECERQSHFSRRRQRIPLVFLAGMLACHSAYVTDFDDRRTLSWEKDDSNPTLQ